VDVTVWKTSRRQCVVQAEEISKRKAESIHRVPRKTITRHIKGQVKKAGNLRRDFDRPNTFAVRFSLVQFGSLWSHARSKSRSVHYGSIWRLLSVDIINFENKYDYPDNYELQQHQRSSVAVEWYKKCITTANSTVLLGPKHTA